MRPRIIFATLAVILALAFAWAQEQKQEQPAPAGAATQTPAAPHPTVVPAEDAARKNPVKFTTVSVERGKKIYDTQCALCHGQKGDGKGELAQEMKIAPPDFTKPETLDKRTDGDLFFLIGSGSGTMPGQGQRLTDRHKWNLVNYLRALSGKTPEKSTGKEPEENVILVPEKP